MGLVSATMAAFRGGLSKTRSALGDPLSTLRGRTIDAQTIDELEHLLLSSDVGVTTTDAIVNDLKQSVSKGALKNTDIVALLSQLMIKRLEGKDRSLHIADTPPHRNSCCRCQWCRQDDECCKNWARIERIRQDCTPCSSGHLPCCCCITTDLLG